MTNELENKENVIRKTKDSRFEKKNTQSTKRTTKVDSKNNTKSTTTNNDRQFLEDR